MPVPHEPVKYNFAAAADLVWALGYLSGQLRDLDHMRTRLGASDLDCPDRPGVSVPWRGSRRDDFDEKVKGEHADLIGLIAETRRLQNLVQEATDAAQRAHSGRR